MSDPTLKQSLKEIEDGLVTVARGIVEITKDSRERFENQIRMQVVLERVEQDIAAVKLALEGPNGTGIKSRLLVIEQKLLVVEKNQTENTTDEKTIKRMWIVALLGFASSLVVGVILRFLIK